MTEFFKNKYRRDEVKLHQFKELITMQFKRIYRKGEADRALKKISKRLRDTGRTLENILIQQEQYNKQPNLEQINIRTFKNALFSMNCIFQQDINNLAKYLDTNNDGMIIVANVKAALAGQQMKSKSSSKK